MDNTQPINTVEIAKILQKLDGIKGGDELLRTAYELFKPLNENERLYATLWFLMAMQSTVIDAHQTRFHGAGSEH